MLKTENMDQRGMLAAPRIPAVLRIRRPVDLVGRDR